MTDKKRGGWTNLASATNGRTATGGGRPRLYATLAKGETLIIERMPLAPDPDHPFTPPERGIVLNVSKDEIEIQIGDDILTISRPSE